jgi:hypothetical protein
MRRINHLPLTIETLKASFDYLATTPPFSSWNLDSDNVTFKVARDHYTAGWYLAKGRGHRRKHLIAISTSCVSKTANLMAIMAHEMVHLHQEITGQTTQNTAHNNAFKCEAESMCAIHGFDPRAY